MSKVQELLKDGRNEELWQLCCGFIDLSLDQFMNIQNSLLLEQIDLLKKSELGRRIFRGAMPNTVEEFRRQVPLTTYSDYCPDLLEKREDILPAKPVRWIQSSGKGGEYPFKWVPISERFWEESGLNFSAVAILGSCHHKGEIAIKSGMKFLHAAAQPPFLTDSVARRAAIDLDSIYLPSLDECEKLPFEQRVQKGFNMALSGGMDVFFGLAGVLVAVGKKFEQGSGKTSKTKLIKHPLALLRLAKGKIRSRREGRQMLPKDLWNLKCLTSMGTDCEVYKYKIHELWGRMPINVYGNTETTIVATQTWDYEDMVFFPNLNFLEFISEEESAKSRRDKTYKPRTILLDQVKSGKTYELVITNFHGGAMVRYRGGDLVRITSLKNEALGINLPQMRTEGRADDLIDLGFMRLNERIIWQALEDTGIPYREWTARKEINSTPRLHIYIELASGYYTSSLDISDKLYKAIKNLDDGLYVYNDIASIEGLIDFKPIEVTILEEGVFSRYKGAKLAENAMSLELKPPHINPSDNDLELLENKPISVPGKFAETVLRK
jgi:hypothetical protein